jgi:hypothetical protein
MSARTCGYIDSVSEGVSRLAASPSTCSRTRSNVAADSLILPTGYLAADAARGHRT